MRYIVIAVLLLKLAGDLCAGTGTDTTPTPDPKNTLINVEAGIWVTGDNQYVCTLNCREGQEYMLCTLNDGTHLYAEAPTGRRCSQ